jgi:AraC-like DNA-binding protein
MASSTSAITISSLTYRETGSDYAIAAHSHQGYQWYCVVFGKVRTVIDGKSLDLGPMDSVLIAPGVSRAPRCSGAAPGYAIASFSNHSLHLENLLGRKVRIPKELTPDLHTLITELGHNPGVNTGEMVDALLVRILIGLARTVTDNKTPEQSGSVPLNKNFNEEIASRAEAFMRRNLHSKLTRDDVAAAVHLSESHLARIFRLTRQQTVIERLTDLRIKRAKQLLLESSMSITQVAFDVGYGSFSHFSKVFKNAVSLRPSDYRRAEGVESRLLRKNLKG